MRQAAVDDVQFLFVRRERKTIWLGEIVHHHRYLPSISINAIHVLRLLFLLGPQAFVVAAYPVRRIGEPN